MPEIPQHTADAVNKMPFHPLMLGELTVREEIADAVNRCILSIDTANETLWKSSVHNSPDSHFTVAGQMTIQGYDALTEYIVGHIFPLTTLHQITNVRVDSVDQYRGKARVSAHAVAHHYRPEDAFKKERLSFVTGGLYDIEIVRDGPRGQGAGTLWKVKGWTLHLLWTEGDRDLVFGTQQEQAQEKSEKM